jgi:hypothetical protein
MLLMLGINSLTLMLPVLRYSSGLKRKKAAKSFLAAFVHNPQSLTRATNAI